MSFGPLRISAIVACLLIAGLPPFVFLRYLESRSLVSAHEELSSISTRMVEYVEVTLDAGVLALTDLHAAGATACDARAIERMRRVIFDTYVLREIAVVDRDGKVVCADTIFKTERWTLARQATVNDRLDTAIVVIEQTGLRSLAMRYTPERGERALVAYFAPNSLALDLLPDPWRGNAVAQLSLLEGTELQTVPPGTVRYDADAHAGLEASAVSSRYPLKVDMRVDRAMLMREFETIRDYAFAAMAFYSAIVLGLAVLIARQRPSIDDDIALGIRRKEFVPYYQPVIDLRTGRLEGCEVLIRRRRRNGTVVSPGAFIAAAEATGRIIPLTRQLMRMTLADLGESYSTRPHLSVAFNLCARHFEDDGIVRDTRTIFDGSPISPGQLVFEVTERYPLADTDAARNIIGELHALGCRISLDDAGTGHGGLASLNDLGIDIVKIDKLFIDPIDGDTRQAPIVDSLVDLAKKLGMDVVAEGVETLEQVRYLRTLGVDSAQGYLFAPPLPARSFITLVEAIGGVPGAAPRQDASAVPINAAA